MLGDRTDGAEDRLDVVAVALELLHRLRRLLDFQAQLVDALYGGVDLLLALACLLLATVGRFGSLAARAGHFVGGGDHFVEGGGHHVDRFTLAPGGFGHIGRDLGRAFGGGQDAVGRLADVLDQAADRRQELVEPVGQLRGFVADTHLQVLGQVAFTLGDAFQAAGNTANWPHDQAGEAGADDRENGRQYCSHASDQPTQLGGRCHDFILLDQANEAPAQLVRWPDVGHIALAIELDLDQALGLSQLRIAGAQFRHVLEVVLWRLGVDQDLAAVFHQHQVTAFAQLDLFDDFRELLERDVDTDHAGITTQLGGDAVHGADVHRVFGCPVVGGGTLGLAGIGNGRLVPRALARIVIGKLGVVRPGDIAAGTGAEDDVGVGRVACSHAVEEGENLLVHFTLRNVGGVGAGVILQAAIGIFQQRLRGQVVDVLADAFEEQLHGIGNLADFAAAAIYERGAGVAAQVHDHQGGNQDDRHAGNDCERPGQFLFDVHPSSGKSDLS
ncbi:hypothetical protein D9M71_315640 [compost metagenome]